MAEYIDREAAREALYQAIKMPSNSALWKTVNYVINTLPAADVRPVRHGRWVSGDMPTYGGFKCSVCGKNTVHYKANYCPNCGARMGATE